MKQKDMVNRNGKRRTKKSGIWVWSRIESEENIGLLNSWWVDRLALEENIIIYIQ